MANCRGMIGGRFGMQNVLKKKSKVLGGFIFWGRFVWEKNYFKHQLRGKKHQASLLDVVFCSMQKG